MHGGFTATIIDNLGGILGGLSSDLSPVATASLEIAYKKPVKVGHEYILKLWVEKIEGRNYFI